MRGRALAEPRQPTSRSPGSGSSRERIGRWARGVDLALYDPSRRDPDAYPGEVKVLYAGRLTTEKGADLLAETFLLARERDPRLHLLLAGGGPEEELLRVRLGEHATFLGWLDREQLADAYASADVFLFCSRTDTYGQVIAEAQASGLPVVAVNEGGPASLIRDRRTGLALRARTPRRSRRRSPSSRPRRSCASGSRGRRWPRSGVAPGRRRWPQLARRLCERRSRARAASPSPRRCARSPEPRRGASL